MSVFGQVRDRLAAAAVLARRGMVDPARPDLALRAFVAMRRYGAFGGLVAYAAARYGDAPAITDDDGTITFRRLDETSNALARGLQANGIRAGGVIGLLNRNHRSIMVTLSAANKIGVRVVLMNTGFAGPQLADVAARELVSCIIADDEFADMLEVLPQKTVRIGSRQLPELIDGQSRSALPAPSRPGGMVLLTSGTTGTPRRIRCQNSTSNLDGDGVRGYIRSHLARHKVPRDVVFVAQLPRNETGKVLKSKLQDHG